MFYGTRISNVRACVRVSVTNSGVTPLPLNGRCFCLLIAYFQVENTYK